MNYCIRLILALVTLCGLASSAAAQELLCDVDVNYSQVQGTNTSMFDNLKLAVSDYMNNTKFTSMQYAANEKIQCKMLITISEYKDNQQVVGDIQVTATRPVYNASYTSPILNFKDSKIDFTYIDGQVLTHTEDVWDSQLTAILDFYANLIIALDTDTFAPRGGQAQWDRIGTIVQMGQSSGEVGWRAFEDTKNRAAVYAAFTQPATAGLRDMAYQYHRKGLDEMVVSPDKGRAAITSSLDELDKVYKTAPMSVGLSMWRDAKLDEIVNIYTKASSTERQNVYELMQRLYPTETTRLEMLRKGVNQ